VKGAGVALQPHPSIRSTVYSGFVLFGLAVLIGAAALLVLNATNVRWVGVIGFLVAGAFAARGVWAGGAAVFRGIVRRPRQPSAATAGLLALVLSCAAILYATSLALLSAYGTGHPQQLEPRRR
jgi:hypothetical protein